MVHRPADSRLLANLLSHEKDYSKYLLHLLEHSQLSLASFSAYAAASPPPLSQTIIAVAAALAGADEALHRYSLSLETWQAQLKALKDLEDEVGNVMRDREILVTRLIKASKQQKPSRDSFLAPSSSTPSLTYSKGEVPLGPKLSAAQAELQACEAHLATKERALESLRASAMQTGLHARCMSLVECGWAWGEMGKEGLRALENIGRGGESVNGHGTQPNTQPGLGNHSDSGHAPSDLSSLAPSQSASQIALPPTPDDGSGYHETARNPSLVSHPAPSRGYTINIPPAHAIAENAVPNGTSSWPHWRISEVEEPPEEEESGGSSVEEDEEMGAVEVHENERFVSKSVSKGSAPASASASAHGMPRPFSIRGRRASEDSGGHVHFPGAPRSVEDGSQDGKRERHRSGSMSLFGRSIAALFHNKDRGGLSPERHVPAAASGSRWQTRTDKHLANTRRDDDSSDDERGASAGPSVQFSTWSPSHVRNDSHSSRAVPVVASASTASVHSATTGQQRLKKPRRNSAGANDRAAAGPHGSAKKAAKAQRQDDAGKAPANRGTPASSPSKGIPPSSEGKTQHVADVPWGRTSLSRNSSLSQQSGQSAASAPARTTARSLTAPAASSSTPQQPTRRAASVEPSDRNTKTTPHGHTRGASVPSVHRSGLTRDTDGPSLMSIVEEVAKQNREARAKQDPNRMLVLPKAPPPASASLDLAHVGKLQSSAGAGSLQNVLRGRPSSSHDRTQMVASASAPVLPLTITKQPPKLPLRSALRNSRTPSPNVSSVSAVPLSLPSTAPTIAPAQAIVTGGVQSIPPTSIVQAKDDDDTASVSSYQTTHENFDWESDSAPPPPPPPHDEKALPTSNSDLSTSTSSTTTTAPARRKSVRMSLPPTFSVTPPALDDDDAEGTRHQPWSAPPDPSHEASGGVGWASRVRDRHTRDVWQDSSEDDDDEEYSMARRLLGRVPKT